MLADNGRERIATNLGPHGRRTKIQLLGPMGPMGTHGDPWGPMGNHGNPWKPMIPHVGPWAPMGTPWSTTETFPFSVFIIHGFPMDFQWIPHGFFHGFSIRFSMDRFSMIFL